MRGAESAGRREERRYPPASPESPTWTPLAGRRFAISRRVGRSTGKRAGRTGRFAPALRIASANAASRFGRSPTCQPSASRIVAARLRVGIGTRPRAQLKAEANDPGRSPGPQSGEVRSAQTRHPRNPAAATTWRPYRGAKRFRDQHADRSMTLGRRRPRRPHAARNLACGGRLPGERENAPGHIAAEMKSRPMTDA